MHEVLVNRLGGLSLPRKSVVSLNDRPDMALDVYRGRKTTIQQHLSRFTVLFNRMNMILQFIIRDIQMDVQSIVPTSCRRILM